MTFSVITSRIVWLSILTIVVLNTYSIEAPAYDVLVIDVAHESEAEKIKQFELDARKLNELHLKGYPANVPEATGSAGERVLGSWTPGGEGGEE